MEKGIGYFMLPYSFQDAIVLFLPKKLAMRSTFPLILIFLAVIGNLTAQNFSETEKQILIAGDTTTMFRVLINTNDLDTGVLGTVSRDIDPNDPLLPLLSRRMYLSMRDTANPGVGIAAPQVGINRNVLWIQRFDKSGSPFEFLINPRVLKASLLSRKGGEGCLSVPDERGELMRSYAILIKYQSFDGEWNTEMLEDFSAVIFQHEYDHLQGILFPDRMRMQEDEISFPSPESVKFFIRPTAN